MSVETKLCKKCGVQKPVSEFSRDKTTKDGLRFYCKVCCAAVGKVYVALNKGRLKARQKIWRLAHADQQREKASRWYHSHKEYRAQDWRERIRFKTHSITKDDAQGVLGIQNNQCPVCLQSLTLAESRIDHAHDCVNQMAHRKMGGKDRGCPLCIRGLLHDSCNTGLYLLEKHPHLQTSLVSEYLKRRPLCHLLQK